MSLFFSDLQVSLPKPPWTGLEKKLESMCRKAILEHKMLHNVKKIAIALSGGKDSLLLLYMLKAIIGRGFDDIPICAIHIHGEMSCGPSISVNCLKKICDDMQVEFITGKLNLGDTTNLNCYKCARERRKLIFNLAKSNNAFTIAFGHHLDDNIQTFLMNLFHKGCIEGFLPKIYFYKYGVTIVRPLIYVDELRIKKFAEKYNFLRNVCRCHIGQKSMRLKTKNIITEIEKYFPQTKSNLANASLIFGSQKAKML